MKNETYTIFPVSVLCVFSSVYPSAFYDYNSGGPAFQNPARQIQSDIPDFISQETTKILSEFLRILEFRIAIYQDQSRPFG